MYLNEVLVLYNCLDLKIKHKSQSKFMIPREAIEDILKQSESENNLIDILNSNDWEAQ